MPGGGTAWQGSEGRNVKESSNKAKIPGWIDELFARELTILRSKGEGQHLEYIQAFPTRRDLLANEMAAFATSRDGLILVGVGDRGY
jgi:hypothetical protein